MKGPAVALNFAVVLLAATAIETGTLMLAVLELNDTLAPSDGAGPLKVTVQTDVPTGPTDAPHWSEDTVTPTTSGTVAFADEPLSEAVIVPV